MAYPAGSVAWMAAGQIRANLCRGALSNLSPKIVLIRFH